MPVRCSKRGNKWVTVDKKGKVHGTHDSSTDCAKQARIINSELRKKGSIKTSEGVAFYSPEDLEFSEIDDLTYEKQLIYEGNFKKNEFEFGVTEETMNHWVEQHEALTSNGIDTPLMKEHSNDPENRLGDIISMSVKEDSKGRVGLFANIKYADSESAKVGLKNQVSLYSPPEYEDGTGNKYVRPIRHVAVTANPVIPQLDKYTCIAASFTMPEEETPDMALKDLAEGIGLSLSEDTQDDAIQSEIITLVKGLKDENLKLSEKVKSLTPADPVRVSNAQVEMLRENRELKLSKLVDDGNITTKVMDDLKDEYCSKDTLSLVLSEDKNDGFDALIKILRNNDPVKLSESTGPQTIQLGEGENPLLKDAERRAAASN